MFETVIQGIFSATFLAAILRVTTPILLPSLGALVSEKAGAINIGLEGMMLSAAFTGVVVSAETQNAWYGLIAGVAIAVLLSIVLAFFHLNLKGDLFLSAIALNIFGSAATVAIMFELTGDRGNTSTLASLQMPFIQLPEWINDIPVVGTFFFDIFDNQSIMTWIAFLSVAVVWYFLYRTPIGMHIRAVGENPEAAASVGINVRRIKYLALMISGFFAGLGGIHMSMGYLTLFQRDMTAGRGFIALVTPALGGGTPVGTTIASMTFGFFDAFAIRLGSLDIPSQLPQMIPFFATVMALVIYALQRQISTRVNTLKTASSDEFDATYWNAIRRLSVLHMLLAMFAVIGVIISISIFSAPNGFGGTETAVPRGLGIGIISLILVGISLPFIINIERIGEQTLFSGGVTTISLTVLVGLFLFLFFPPLIALIGGLLLGLAIWAVLGGWYLTQNAQSSFTSNS